ncbi:MAG: hypothetical protein ACYTG7_01660 [Planctomycetota bacterium]
MLNITAVVGITFLFFVIYKEKKEGEFEPQNPKIFVKLIESGIDKEQKSGPAVININDYSALWNANISGIRKQPEAPKVEDEVIQIDEDPLSDIVEIMGILKSTVPAESMTRLRYVKEDMSAEKQFKLEIWTREGEALKPPYDAHPYYAKIDRIEDEQVIFSYRGEEVALSPETVSPKGRTPASEDDETAAVSGVPKEVLDLYPEPPKETVEIKPGYWYFSKKETTFWANDWEQELKSSPIVGIRNPKSGKTELTLTKVPENSMAAQRGFQSNDVLISINGTPIHNKPSAINYFNEHPNEGSYVVQFRRAGRIMTKTFVVPPE